MKQAFSTLGCPFWSLNRSVKYAAELEYDAVAVRFLDGMQYLPDFPVFQPDNIESTLRLFTDNGVELYTILQISSIRYIAFSVQCFHQTSFIIRQLESHCLVF